MKTKPAKRAAKNPSDTTAPKDKKKPVVRHLEAGQKERTEISSDGSLLGNYAPGFENDGKRILAKCPEFKLWELYHEGGPQKLETDEGIHRAEQKALLRIREAKDESWTDSGTRLDYSLALLTLLGGGFACGKADGGKFCSVD